MRDELRRVCVSVLVRLLWLPLLVPVSLLLLCALSALADVLSVIGIVRFSTFGHRRRWNTENTNTCTTRDWSNMLSDEYIFILRVCVLVRSCAAHTQILICWLVVVRRAFFVRIACTLSLCMYLNAHTVSTSNCQWTILRAMCIREMRRTATWHCQCFSNVNSRIYFHLFPIYTTN